MFRIFLRELVIKILRLLYKVYGYDIDKSAKVSVGAKLDRTNPRGIHIGEESYIASGARILSHDYCRSLHRDVYIGKRCFVGADSLILPGVFLHDNTVVAAGAVITKSPQCGGNSCW